MKKLFLVLSLLICICFNISAYDYDIQRFLTDEDIEIKRVYNDVVVAESNSMYKMYDISGNLLNNMRFSHIFPYNYEMSIFNCYENAVFVSSKENLKKYIGTALSAYYDEKIYNSLKTYYLLHGEESTSYAEDINVTIFHTCDALGNIVYSYIPQLPLDEKYKKAYNDLHKVMIKQSDGVGSALWDNCENRLTDYVSAEWMEDGLTPGFTRGIGKNKNWICNQSTGDWIEINEFADGTVNYGVGVGVIEKTEKGKYIYYNNRLNQVTDIEFDEFLGVYNTSAIFKHQDKYYGFDTEWKLAYTGNKKIKAVYFDNYVMENEDGFLGLYDEKFNIIIPPEYDNISWICENVFVAEKDGCDYLYNQSRIVADGYSFYNSKSVYEPKKMYIDVLDTKAREQCILDIEGNEIIRSNTCTFETNGYDIYINENNAASGRVIFKDTNPNVRINGKLLVSDTMARIKNNITLVPLRALAEKTGFNVSYNEETKEIKISKDDKEIKFTLGEKKCYSNGVEISLDAAPQVINNRTLVPARAISDAFGYDISWDEERRLVEINTSADTTANSD